MRHKPSFLPRHISSRPRRPWTLPPWTACADARGGCSPPCCSPNVRSSSAAAATCGVSSSRRASRSSRPRRSPGSACGRWARRSPPAARRSPICISTGLPNARPPPPRLWPPRSRRARRRSPACSPPPVRWRAARSSGRPRRHPPSGPTRSPASPRWERRRVAPSRPPTPWRACGPNSCGGCCAPPASHPVACRMAKAAP